MILMMHLWVVFNLIDYNINILLIKKAISILEIVFENGDYGFYNVRLSDYYAYLARHYMCLNDVDQAIGCVESASNHAVAYDTLPGKITYTSAAVKGYITSDESVKNYSYNDSYKLLNNEFSKSIFDKIRECERFKAAIAKLEKHARK